MFILRKVSSIGLTLFTLMLLGCSNNVELLKVEKAQLTQINENLSQLQQYAKDGELSPQKFDAHIHLGVSPFNDAFKSLDEIMFEVSSDKKPINIVVKSIRPKFSSGNVIAEIEASATDPSLGITANIVLDGVFFIETNDTGSLTLKVNATNVAPEITWRWFNLSKFLFVRRIAQLKVYEITENLPKIVLPYSTKLGFNIKARSKTETFPSGDGSMSGVIKSPPIKLSNILKVKHIIFLENGVHLLADMEA